MPEIYSEQLIEAARILVLAGVIRYAYSAAHKAGEANGRLNAMWKGAAWCLGLALFTAALTGQPSCADAGDMMFGNCDQFDDNGYIPSMDARAARFIFYFIILIVPAALGIMESRKYSLNPWRRPDATSDR